MDLPIKAHEEVVGGPTVWSTLREPKPACPDLANPIAGAAKRYKATPIRYLRCSHGGRTGRAGRSTFRTKDGPHLVHRRSYGSGRRSVLDRQGPLGQWGTPRFDV